MKLAKDDISLLFSPSGAPSEAPARAPAVPAPAPAIEAPSLRHSEPAEPSDAHPAPRATATPRAARASVLGLLKKTGPTLWQKIDPRVNNKRDRRAQFIKLLTWLAQKHGWRWEENALQPYLAHEGRVEGRLHLLLRAEDEAVAVEVCFALDGRVLNKLHQAHRDGRVPLLLWAGNPCTRADLLTRISALSSGERLNWLEVCNLA